MNVEPQTGNRIPRLEVRGKLGSKTLYYLSEHNADVPPLLSDQFPVLAKGSNKFDCLIKEMLSIRKLKPSLNVLVYYTAVFSVVTQRGGALRDDTKNGCVADYKRGGGLDSRKGIHLKNL